MPRITAFSNIHTHKYTSIKTELLHPVNGRNPPCLPVQLSTKPEWIRAVVTFKFTLTACTWLSTFKK